MKGLNGGFWHWIGWRQLVLLLVQMFSVYFASFQPLRKKHSFPDKTNWPDFYLIWQEPPQGTTSVREALKHIKMVYLLSKLHLCPCSPCMASYCGLKPLKLIIS